MNVPTKFQANESIRSKFCTLNSNHKVSSLDPVLPGAAGLKTHTQPVFMSISDVISAAAIVAAAVLEGLGG